MAKQVGPILFTGTIDGVCYYRLNEDYYARTCPAISKERFWKSIEFEGSRKRALMLARAAVIASRIYRNLPKEERSRERYRRIVAEVMHSSPSHQEKELNL